MSQYKIIMNLVNGLAFHKPLSNSLQKASTRSLGGIYNSRQDLSRVFSIYIMIIYYTLLII